MSSCSDNQITEIDHPEDEETPEVVLNEEPPELVQDYYDLVGEIEKDYLDGVEDSTKILQANRLAIELAKYDGPMAFIFKLEEAESKGKSEEELQEIVAERYGLTTLTQASHPCMDDCHEDLATEVGDAYEDWQSDRTHCAKTGIGVVVGGLVGSGGLGGVGAGVAGGISWGGGCALYARSQYHTALERAERDWNVCMRRCYERYGPQ